MWMFLSPTPDVILTVINSFHRFKSNHLTVLGLILTIRQKWKKKKHFYGDFFKLFLEKLLMNFRFLSSWSLWWGKIIFPKLNKTSHVLTADKEFEVLYLITWTTVTFSVTDYLTEVLVSSHVDETGRSSLPALWHKLCMMSDCVQEFQLMSLCFSH